jgi:hypothetical protein
MGVEHQPRSVLVGLGVKGLLLILGIFGVALIGLWVVRSLVGRNERIQRFISQHGHILVVLVLCVCVGLVAGLSFVSWPWLGAAIAISVLVLAALWAGTSFSLSPSLAAVAGVILALLAIFATAAFQLGGRATVQAIRFRQVPRQLASLSPVPETLTRAHFPYFGEDGSSIYVGAIRSYIPDVFPYNFCPDEPRIIVEVPRNDVDVWFLSRPIDLSHSSEPPGTQLWHWLVGTKHKQAPFPTGHTPQQRKEMRRQCQIMANAGELPYDLPTAWKP